VLQLAEGGLLSVYSGIERLAMLLGVLEELQKAAVNFLMSVSTSALPSAQNNSAST
jgi:hypothetical protein